jgi:SAM-dependent methyltransferase
VTVLHLGCGRKKLPARDVMRDMGLSLDLGDAEPTMVHLDADPTLHPHYVCTLGEDSIPLADNTVDVALANHVIEHIGKTGEPSGWFAFWEDLYRVLRPGGTLFGVSPLWSSVWAWGDPSHVREISRECFTFLAQGSYRIPGNVISPFRVRCDFGWASMPGLETGSVVMNPGPYASIGFALTAIKPLRPWWED